MSNDPELAEGEEANRMEGSTERNECTRTCHYKLHCTIN